MNGYSFVICFFSWKVFACLKCPAYELKEERKVFSSMESFSKKNLLFSDSVSFAVESLFLKLCRTLFLT